MNKISEFTKLIGTILLTLFISLLSWLAFFVWDIDNRVQYLINTNSVLITNEGQIRPSIEVEILKEKVSNLEKKIYHLECN